jgi:hypothetical protein
MLSMMEIIQTIVESVAVIVLLPTFDQASAAVMTTCMTLSIPLVFNGFVNPYFRLHKYYHKSQFFKDHEDRLINMWRGIIAIMALAVVSFLIAYMALVSKEEVNLPALYILTIICIVCLSCGFGENVSGILIERHRYWSLAFTAFKIVVYFLSFVATVGTMSHESSVSGVRVLFGMETNATIAMIDKNILLISTSSFGRDCSVEHPFYVALVSLIASYLCFKACYQACRTYLQFQSFSIPLLLNLILIPVGAGFFLEPNSFYSNVGNCEIISKDWDFIVVGNLLSEIMIGLCGGFTLLSVVLLTTYTWRSGMRIAKLERYVSVTFFFFNIPRILFCKVIVYIYQRRFSIAMENLLHHAILFKYKYNNSLAFNF